MNLNASPLDLYDVPSPQTGVSVRYAIELHREGQRAPVMMSPENPSVVV